MAETRGKGTSLRSVANLWVRPLQSRKPSFVLGLLDWRKREEEKISLREMTNLQGCGGSERIRTSGTVTRTHAFQACSLNHSDTLPREVIIT